MKNNDLFPSYSLDLIKNCVSSGNTYLYANSKLIFTCGARSNSLHPGGRDRLMEYAKIHIKDCHFFMAEKFFEVFQNEHKKDLLSIEDQLAQYCDCIVIILESESAFTELGAFSIKDDLAKIMLVINDIDFKESKSFISLGPLAKLDKISDFKPSIFVKSKSILSAASEINTRLQKIIKKRKIRLPIKSYKDFTSLKPQSRMFFISDIISLFHPVSHQDLIQILKDLFGDNHDFDISIDESLLFSLGLVTKNKEYYVQSSRSTERFFKFEGVNEVNARAAIVNHYHKHFKNKIRVLKEKVLSINV